MKLNDIVKLVNQKLAGEMMTYQELRPYLDSVVDNINTELDCNFPVFASLADYTTDYVAIPDKYIRTVIVPGAAWYYYVMDEEGTITAPQYQADFRLGLFYMLRDYVEQIPVEYQNTVQQGMVHLEFDLVNGSGGVWVGTMEGID